MARALIAVLFVALATLLAACGEEDDAPGGASGERPAQRLSLGQARSFIERDGVSLVRTGAGRAAVATELEPRPTDSARLEAQNGREFDLLAFDTPTDARAAWARLKGTDVIDDGGAAMRAVNLVAVFPQSPEDGVYGRVKRSLREIAVACGRRGDPPGLRELCPPEDEGTIPPAEPGTATEELAPVGATVTVGGIDYTVTLTRRLNPRITPDRALVSGRTPADGKMFLGVIVRACNESGAPARSSDRLALVGAFGRRAQPVDLPAANRFEYEPRLLEEGDCHPRQGSVAARVLDGALLLFEVPSDRLQDRPVGLEVSSPDGSERSTIRLDV